MGKNKNESREIKDGSVEEVQMLGREFGKSEWNLNVVLVIKKEKAVGNQE